MNLPKSATIFFAAVLLANSQNSTEDISPTIPFFLPWSYMKFPRFDQAYSKFYFEITFKPEKSNGLILYNGQRKNGGDYIALSLVDGVPQFRYSFYDQQGVATSEKSISLSEWHTIKVNRVRTNGLMIVDDEVPTAFPPSQRFYGLNLEEELYLGGVPDFDLIAPTATEWKEGFVGCISRLVLNDHDVQINQESLEAFRTTACEPCAEEPCQNDGACLESQTEFGYKCVCKDGYTGRTCQNQGQQCTVDVCGTGRCEVTETGIECYCPLNRTGERCENIEHFSDEILSFKDGSFAAYDKLSGKKNIKFKINPASDTDGVILYAGESSRGYGDFYAVVIKDKHIEFRYMIGGKVTPVILRSQTTVKVNAWIDISVGRTRAGLGYLQVDNEPQINEQKQAGRAQILYLTTNLYVGGYDKRVILNPGVGVTRGFEGCVINLEVAGKSVNMIEKIRDSANVQKCGHQFQPDELSHDEAKSDHLIVSDVCLAQKPCENGGMCANLPDVKYQCDCTFGYSGDRCQNREIFEKTVAFKGNGYLELDRSTIADSAIQVENGIALMFSTMLPNGLILWYGQNKSHAYNGEDFISLAIVEGHLEFVYHLNGKESIIRHTKRIEINQRHIAILEFKGTLTKLELDGLTEYNETQIIDSKEINLPGNIFLGGAPDLKSFTGNRYSQGLFGCIPIVESLDGSAIQFGEKTISGLNVVQCEEIESDLDEFPMV